MKQFRKSTFLLFYVKSDESENVSRTKLNHFRMLKFFDTVMFCIDRNFYIFLDIFLLCSQPALFGYTSRISIRCCNSFCGQILLPNDNQKIAMRQFSLTVVIHSAFFSNCTSWNEPVVDLKYSRSWNRKKNINDCF